MSDQSLSSSVISRNGYDAVIFDLDGVITKTARIHARAWKSLFDGYLKNKTGAESIKPFDIVADYRNFVDGKPRYEGVKSFLASRDIKLPYGNPADAPDRETVCGLGNRKNQLFKEYLKKEGVDVYENSVDLVMLLRDKGLRTAVVSSSKNCAAILEAAHISSIFDIRVDGIDSEDMGLRGKPDPDIFLEAAYRLGVEPERCVVLEDAIAGVQAGRKGGFGLVIGVNRRNQERPLYDAGADLVIEDLSEVLVEERIRDLPSALNAYREIEKRIKDDRVIVFLDYDGTLTPIVTRPEDALLSEEMRINLADLAGQCSVAVISGRDLRDISQRVGIETLYYAGSHGFEIEGPGDLRMEREGAAVFLPLLDEAEKKLRERLTDIRNVQVERKKFSIAIHYRNVKEEQAGTVEEIVDNVMESYTQLRKTKGKKIYELQPAIDWDKGRAVSWLLNALGLDGPDVLPVYVGDDTTDEDAFRALKSQGIGIIVGEGNRNTLAHYRLKDTEEVGEFIENLSVSLREKNAWLLMYKGFDPEQEGLREALCTLGNGYFATRGAAPESVADAVHYPGTYLAGGYNRLKTVIDGRTIENEDLVNFPNWLCLTFRIPGEDWFNLEDVEIISYCQEMDIKHGILYRRLHIRDRTGREFRIRQRRIVSMADIHIGALETIIIPVNWSGTIEIRSALDGRVTNSGVERYKELNNLHLKALETKQTDEKTILLKVSTNQSGLTVSQAARTEIFKGSESLAIVRQLERENGYIAHHVKLEVSNGDRIIIKKTVSLFSSRDRAISECGLEAEKAVLEAGRFHEVLDAHMLAWKQLWRRFGINLKMGSIGHDIKMQRILRLYSFHLLESVSLHSLDIDTGVPSRGWHGEAYRGHIFWDELIIFPFLNYRAPQITRSLLMYRYRRLGEARRAARALGYKGAMYPWQSGSNGKEESQRVHLNPESGRWIPDNSRLQRHINSAIVYNIWQYYQVTGDLEFLSFFGAEMILEIARFWSSMATYNADIQRYEILGVMGPDEYHDAYPGADPPGLNNNAYTNIMAVFVFNRSLEIFDILQEEQCRQLCERLGIEESEKQKWDEIRRKMRIVFLDNGVISQFEGYDRLQEFNWEEYRKKYGNIQRLDRILEAEGSTTNRYRVSKQADVLMLFYLFSAEELEEMFKQLGYSFEYETIPKNIDYYLARTSNGSSLSWIIHSWVAARRDRRHSWKLFNQALKTDIADIQGGTTPEGIHLGAMAGCVDLVQRGYTGLEARGNVLRFNPKFPDELQGIGMHIRYHGHWLELEITSEGLKIKSLGQNEEPIRIEVKDRKSELKAGKTLQIDFGKE